MGRKADVCGRKRRASYVSRLTPRCSAVMPETMTRRLPDFGGVRVRCLPVAGWRMAHTACPYGASLVGSRLGISVAGTILPGFSGRQNLIFSA